MRVGETTIATLTDEQLTVELAWARFQRTLGGNLGQRTRIVERIRVLECEMLNRCLAAS